MTHILTLGFELGERKMMLGSFRPDQLAEAYRKVGELFAEGTIYEQEARAAGLAIEAHAARYAPTALESLFSAP